MNDDLERLAVILNNWVTPMPVVDTPYLFGSRVRGDHRPDSDVDVHILFDASRDMSGWLEANENKFRDINALLPGRLALHQEQDDVVVPRVIAAAMSPKLVVGKVVCVELPKPSRG
jgi:predicted nucleotidyltransferase